MAAVDTLLLTRSDVADLLDLDVCIAAVEEAFRAHGTSRPPTGVLGMPVPGGGFHIKAGVLEVGGRPYFAAKTNANFPANPSRHKLPTIQGVIVLADAERGTPLAVLDSGEITSLRTAAATAVAARHLARADAHSTAIIGCGVQGRVQLKAVASVRKIDQVRLYDRDPGHAEKMARAMRRAVKAEITIVDSPRAAARPSDIVITCTSSHEPLLTAGDVMAGSFVAGVGADHPEKNELAPALLAASRVVVDVLDQAATIGDLHHALAAGAMTREDVAAELGAIVAGRAPGRTTAEQVFVFDSTGMALQDVAAAVVVYERARKTRRGVKVRLGQ
ncbi:MAG TPA: ornithine cyclodeaminase family protein [Gemmatimonadales bacterium]|nr:ornithine cyclodeaminase family protein [Gemmatimonadales bacterium]